MFALWNAGIDESMQKAFGGNYGLTAKIPKDALKITAGKTKEFAADNGSGSIVHREFCDNCGSFICEYGVSFCATFHEGLLC